MLFNPNGINIESKDQLKKILDLHLAGYIVESKTDLLAVIIRNKTTGEKGFVTVSGSFHPFKR